MTLDDAIQLRDDIINMGYEAVLIDHYQPFNRGNVTNAVRATCTPDVDIDGIPLGEMYCNTDFMYDTIYW